MKRKSKTISAYSFLILLLICACNPINPPTPAEIPPTAPPPTAPPPTAPAPTALPPTALPPTASPTPVSVTGYGNYYVGARTYTMQDRARGDRQVSITVWYPAISNGESMIGVPIKDAEPDRSEQPYPLILSSTKVAQIFAPYLVSHGFTWASVDKIDFYMAFYEGAIDQPLDILFALDQVDANPPDGLDGMIDADNAATIGYSFDGFNSLAMSGARIDAEHYLAQCLAPDATTEAIVGNLSAYWCLPARKWDSFTAHVGESITTSEDGLWQPLTDERIRAVMPMAGEGWWLFGERGLASVDRPVLIIVATNDELYKENTLIYEHIGTSDKTLISFIGKDHMMVYEDEFVKRIAEFAVAFFGYHLQGHEEFIRYFSEDFVSHQDGLAWGVYNGE